jgi:F-type H+-transporting ATPase subunit gamma
MSNKIREIRRRIKAVKNTRTITKAMQLVAASKMKKAQDQAIAGRPYAIRLADLMQLTLARIEKVTHPYFDVHGETAPKAVLVLATDKGLCGALNANLFRLLSTYPENTQFVAVGRKAVQFLVRSNRSLVGDFSVRENVPFADIRAVVEFITRRFLSGEFSSVDIAYNRFLNTLKQEPVIYPLLPLKDIDAVLSLIRKGLKAADLPTPPPVDDRMLKFEPSAEEVLAELPPLFLKKAVYQLMLEARASEHSARMVAMKTATDNASKLVDSLSLQYNKARQAAITQEIQEISGSLLAQS